MKKQQKNKGKISDKLFMIFLMFWIAFVSLGASYSYSALFSKGTDQKTNSASFVFHSNEETDPPLSDYEIQRLFPTINEDWKWIQSVVGVSGLRLPYIYWQTGQRQGEDTTNGLYQAFGTGEFYNAGVISFERSIFATSTPAYARYVLLHELTHAALTASSLKIDSQHCYMVKEGFFRKIGQRIGDIDLGINEEQRHNILYNCNVILEEDFKKVTKSFDTDPSLLWQDYPLKGTYKVGLSTTTNY